MMSLDAVAVAATNDIDDEKSIQNNCQIYSTQTHALHRCGIENNDFWCERVLLSLIW